MSVIRVHKTKNFTVMSNTHLRDMDLSLKAKGLLSVMLSLPDNWNYSIAGLCSICKENETAIKSTIKELREKRYVIVDKKFPNETESKKYEYVYNIFEEPQEKNQAVENQGIENLPLDNLPIENHPLNKRTDISKTDKANTDLSNTDGLNTEKGENINKVNAKVKTCSLQKKSMDTPRARLEKYRSMKSEEADMIEQIRNICDSVFEKEDADEISKTLEYYFRRYTEKTGKIHPILKTQTLIDIIEKIYQYSDTEYYHFERVIDDKGAFIKIVDAFFDEDFGARTGQRTNWNLPHFMSDGVLDRLAQRLNERGDIQ